MTDRSPLSPDRRTFLQAAGVAAGLTAVGVRPAVGLSAPVEAFKVEEWDLSWLDGLTGTHKQVFDLGSLHRVLHVVGNYLKAANEVFGLEYPDVNTVVGIATQAFPINVEDAIWAKYELGKHWDLKDPATGEWAVRNLYDADPPPEGSKPEYMVRALRKRGAIFWQCNNALNAIVEQLAGRTNQDRTAVRKELIDGFLPGVILVPAHTLLIGLTQERGCTYEKL